MSITGFESEAVSTSVKTQADLTIAGGTSLVILQAQGNHIRYTMDGNTVPTTSSGMLLRTGDPPQEFLVGDLQNIKFIRDGGSDSVLAVHYVR